MGPDHVRVEEEDRGGAHQRGEDDDDENSIPLLPHFGSVHLNQRTENQNCTFISFTNFQLFAGLPLLKISRSRIPKLLFLTRLIYVF